MSANAANEQADITVETIRCAEKLADLSFTDGERAQMLDEVRERVAAYRQLRAVDLPNSTPPALVFDPQPLAKTRPAAPAPRRPLELPAADLPADLAELAFWPVHRLAGLIRTRQISAAALTELYLERLKRFDPQLQCVITLTEELAREQAQRADAEIAAGRYRGPLHGIPWGAKDLLAVRGYPTTWGATPYREQVIDMDATVVQRLEAAGAVLVAKLSMGALAWGDVWFGGTTKTPWDLKQGASGSSAGSGAATAAGLVGFAIGTETWGSIVSPATRNGVSGLRPTFGRVSRHGAMALSWSMDKIGPMCRSVQDCALVFQAIHGPDASDPTVVDRPFVWPRTVDLARLRIGYVADAFESDYAGRDNDLRTLDALRALGADLIPIQLPAFPSDALQIILTVEAAAAFDELTRTNRDDLLVRQSNDAWPNVFRQARLIPAVEYIQANRIRTQLMQAMAELMDEIDVYVAPSIETDNLLLTNLSGHPAVVVPNGFSAAGLPTSITFTGGLFEEELALAVARICQDATDFHQQHPRHFDDQREEKSPG
ncbi:MAG TPA: amidase [Caldilineae bacterium]|nr:amidase [Caldilineae bacterium]